MSNNFERFKKILKEFEFVIQPLIDKPELIQILEEENYDFYVTFLNLYFIMKVVENEKPFMCEEKCDLISEANEKVKNQIVLFLIDKNEAPHLFENNLIRHPAEESENSNEEENEFNLIYPNSPQSEDFSFEFNLDPEENFL